MISFPSIQCKTSDIIRMCCGGESMLSMLISKLGSICFSTNRCLNLPLPSNISSICDIRSSSGTLEGTYI